MRLLIQVAPADQTQSLAIRFAERRERRRQDELFSEEWREIDLEVAADALGIGGRNVLRITTHHVDRRVVLLGEMRLDRRLDRPQAAAALLGDGRLRIALEVRAGIGVGREDLSV